MLLVAVDWDRALPGQVRVADRRRAYELGCLARAMAPEGEVRGRIGWDTRRGWVLLVAQAPKPAPPVRPLRRTGRRMGRRASIPAESRAASPANRTPAAERTSSPPAGRASAPVARRSVGGARPPVVVAVMAPAAE